MGAQIYSWVIQHRAYCDWFRSKNNPFWYSDDFPPDLEQVCPCWFAAIIAKWQLSVIDKWTKVRSRLYQADRWTIECQLRKHKYERKNSLQHSGGLTLPDESPSPKMISLRKKITVQKSFYRSILDHKDCAPSFRDSFRSFFLSAIHPVTLKEYLDSLPRILVLCSTVNFQNFFTLPITILQP